ncbi:tetratricopeptide repeat protein [Xanthocytophaga agilis]|uniref:tetratricopeptide repeat protein n=1 Tax=Xanthocytophaga agilis TaxID=3048010 RepID=UPI0028D40D91|nr:tetratricopeptide repeat protein [Xanthocytophaga agilis]
MDLVYQKYCKDNENAEKYYLRAVEKGYEGAMNNLGHLYENEYKDYSKAERYYLMAIEKGGSDAMYNLGLLYEEQFRDYVKAEQYYLMASESDQTGEDRIELLKFYYRTKQMDKVLKISDILFEDELFKLEEENIIDLIRFLLVVKQYHFLLQKFRSPNNHLLLLERPMYYTLSWFMKAELPGEYKKTNEELKETVDEIIKEVEFKYGNAENLL